MFGMHTVNKVTHSTMFFFNIRAAQRTTNEAFGFHFQLVNFGIGQERSKCSNKEVKIRIVGNRNQIQLIIRYSEPLSR